MVASCMDFKIVDASDNVLFDLDDPTGAANPYGLETSMGDIDIGVAPIEIPALQHGSGIPGAMFGEDDLQPRQVSWTMAHVGTTNDDPDEMRKALNHLASLLREGSRKGNRILFVPRSGMDTRYIRWLGTDELPPLLRGQTAGLDQMYEVHDGNFSGFTPYRVIAQPLLQWDDLEASVNLIGNPTLLLDTNANNTPDGWAWDATTDITNQTIDPDAEGPLDNWLGTYGFDIATGDVRTFRRSSLAASFAPGDEVAFAFYAKASAAGIAQARALGDFRSTAPADTEANAGTLTPIGTSWTLVSVLGDNAPASTDHVRAGIQFDNTGATPVHVELATAMLAKDTSVPEFRVGPQVIVMDPVVENGRVALVYNPGEAPARVTTKLQAPTGTVAGAGHGLLLGLQTQAPVSYANGGKSIQGESFNSGTDSANAVNASASSGNVKRTTFSNVGLVSRLNVTRSTFFDTYVGRRFRVIANVISSATVSGVMQLVWGPSASSSDLSNAEVPYAFTGAEVMDIDLGEIAIGEDWTSIYLQLFASRTGGSGNLDWDFVAPVPVDDSALRVEQANDIDDGHYYLFKPPGMGLAPSASVYTNGNLLQTQSFDVLDGDLPLWVPPGLSALYIQVNDDVTGARNVSVLTRSMTVSFDLTAHDYLA